MRGIDKTGLASWAALLVSATLVYAGNKPSVAIWRTKAQRSPTVPLEHLVSATTSLEEYELSGIPSASTSVLLSFIEESDDICETASPVKRSVNGLDTVWRQH